MKTVSIKPSKDGQLISMYKGNAEFGFITLTSSQQTVSPDGWIREQTRTTLLRAETPVLERFVKDSRNLTLPGQIVVNEFVESQVPPAYRGRLNEKVPYEDAIAGFIKRAGKDGIELTVGGERILRFTTYDMSGSLSDSIVAHDNTDDVKASKSQSANSKEADL